MAGTGSLTGIVNASGTTVSINPGGSFETLTTGAITGTTSVLLVTTGGSSQIVIPAASIITGPSVTITGGSIGVNVSGTVSANAETATPVLSTLHQLLEL